jgi:micrococcal nuclease
MRKLLFALLIFCTPTWAVYAGDQIKVTRVVDGDTVVLRIDNRDVRCRLIGVDTPETVHPNKRMEYFGKEASEFLKHRVESKVIEIAHDRPTPQYDRYGRLLIYLYRDKVLINQEIIEKGYGHTLVKYPFAKLPEFRAAERRAREANRGLWAPGHEHPRPAREPHVCGEPCQRIVTDPGFCYQHRR